MNGKKVPRYMQARKLSRLYRIVSRRWPAHPRTIRIYRALALAIRMLP